MKRHRHRAVLLEDGELSAGSDDGEVVVDGRGELRMGTWVTLVGKSGT